MMVLCLGLTACNASTQSSKPYFAPSVIAECPSLQRLPETDLRMADVEKLWARDRVQYLDCASGKAELIRTMKERGLVQ